LTEEIIIENINDVGRIAGEPLYDPLILYINNYSIFIQVSTNSDTSRALSSIICSLDLKINIQTNLYTTPGGNKISAINLFNSNSNIYIIYEDTTETYIETQKILQCINNNSIILSDDVSKEIIIFNTAEHENDIITFSLDDNINVYRDNEIVSSKSFISLKESKNFYFGKKQKSGVFQNYYAYVNKEANGFYQQFSLICPINITVCYSSCQKCNANEIPTEQNQLCKSCLNNYYPKYSEINHDTYNCYDNSDIRISHYYLYNNQYYLECHESCKACLNGYSCLSCNDGYYFKSDIYNQIISGICYKSKIAEYYLDNTVNIFYEGEFVQAVYKPCYTSCYYCIESGTYESNNCISCKNGINYPFSTT
jgi:hypothetical protein